MKINKIIIKDFKAIENLELLPNSFSIMVVGGNRKGKTTALRSFFDRVNGSKNKNILRTGAENGVQTIEFTDGNVVRWEVSASGAEKFTLITKDGITVKNSVLSQIQELYFGGGLFNINKFLALSAKDKTEKLLKLIGVDFNELNKDYKNFYDLRTKVNSELDLLVKTPLTKPEPVEGHKPLNEILLEIADEEFNITEQNAKILKENGDLIEEWSVTNKNLRKEVDIFNQQQNEKYLRCKAIEEEWELINKSLLYFKDYFYFDRAKQVIDFLDKPSPLKEYEDIPRPELKQSLTTSTKLEELKLLYSSENDKMWKYQAYLIELERYNSIQTNIEALKTQKAQLNTKMEAINHFKKEALRNAQLPEGFEITEDNETLYNGYPLTEDSQSLSSLYIAGLKLASLSLGELKTIHFEASSLDKFSLFEVYEFAQSVGLQLLVEARDFEGGEIHYEIINEV